MNVLVLNAGSSSIKFSVFRLSGTDDEPSLLLDGELSGLGDPEATLAVSRGDQPQEKHAVQGTDTPAGSVGAVLDAVHGVHADAVGYRVVHPGPRIKAHVRITESVLSELQAAADYAPLHDPEALALIRETMRRMPDVPHVACFDTIFHHTMPQEASIYPIPAPLRALGIRRYGFHGLSCESVVRQLQRAGPLPARLAIAHLGSGCSVTAVRDGASIDTTMGFTPTGGVVMGTRPGDLDPGLMLYLLRQQTAGDAAGELETMLNHHAGMVALTGLANDMQVIRKAAEAKNEAAALGLKVFTRSIRKALGGFAWLMGSLDAIVFTGGIGEHDAATRAEILAGSDLTLNFELNQSRGVGVQRVSASDSKTAVLVVTAQEDLVIALHVRTIVQADA